MIASRRQVLSGAGAATAAAMVGGALSLSADAHTLLLFSDGLRDSPRAARLRAEVGGRATEATLALLSPAGLAATRALIARAGNGRLQALLDDGDALVIERLLAHHGARHMAMRREPTHAGEAPGPMLLAATLQTISGRG